MSCRHSVLINSWSCNHCSEESKLYLDQFDDGSIKQRYEGCGGFMGRNRELDGKEVSREEAISSLEVQVEALHEEMRQMFSNLHSAERMLKRLKKLGTK